jgi:creatinine amidohydrolase
LSVYHLEEVSTPVLDALDRQRTMVILAVSPLEQHGPHLPVGVDAFTAGYFARAVGERLVAARPGWSAVLAPTLYLGSFAFEAPGTVAVRPRVVRDALVDYGESFARSGFRWILVANGHAGPTHLAALEEAAAIVSRRRGVRMASLSGHLFWRFRSGGFLDRVEAALGRPLSAAEHRAFGEDAHAGWWETSMMLMLRPDLVDGGYRALPPAAYRSTERLVPDYPLRGGGRGYVGHPALADPAFARATADVLISEAMTLVDTLLDGGFAPGQPRSLFSVIPFFRTNFWPLAAAAGLALAVLGWGRRRERP